MNNNCEFWRAQWDGTLCHLLSSDYQHVSARITLLQRFFKQDCESFAGAVTVKDCTEGPDSCYAYVEDDCVYTGERVGEVCKV